MDRGTSFLALYLYRTVYPVKGLSEFLQVGWSLIYGVFLLPWCAQLISDF